MAEATLRAPGGLRNLLRDFSTGAPPGRAVLPCGTNALAQLPTVPCNLQQIQVDEVNGQPTRESGKRSATVARTITVRPGDPAGQPLLQVTAASAKEAPRKLVLRSTYQCQCGNPTHNQLVVVTPGGQKPFGGTSAQLSVHRRKLIYDGGALDKLAGEGPFALVKAYFNDFGSREHYSVVAASCGLPSNYAAIPQPGIVAYVEVFPADLFKMALEFPTACEPKRFQVEGKTARWQSWYDKHSEKVEKDGTSYYKENEAFFREAGLSEAEVVDSFKEMSDRRLGEEEPTWAGRIKFSLTRTDGATEYGTPEDSTRKLKTLLKSIRDAEEAIRNLNSFLRHATVGVGASVEIKPAFLALSLNAQWSNEEYTDWRVYRAYKASLDLTLFKLEAKIACGVRCAGFFDAYVELGGEGSIKASAELSSHGPGQRAPAEIKPQGEVKITGSLKGEFGWTVKLERSIEVTFVAEMEKFHFMTEQDVIGGEISIKREPANYVFVASNSMMRRKSSRKKPVEWLPEHVYGPFTF
ncbi:hypothetical protein [Ramlibacter sp.]|uniref:hypothetical protein n=1 Tax=Ramlibacter sp. TaxID=1917967 RepID=UPI002D74B2F3|nr:hypothetical protein [Ramlibacter sp.]HYD76637.1 hypothetical protein [Ramlibacter sp.]